MLSFINVALVIVSFPSNRTATKMEVGTRNGVAVISLTILLVARMWVWGLWVRKAVECFKRRLLGHKSGSMENSSSESNVDYDGST